MLFNIPGKLFRFSFLTDLGSWLEVCFLYYFKYFNPMLSVSLCFHHEKLAYSFIESLTCRDCINFSFGILFFGCCCWFTFDFTNFTVIYFTVYLLDLTLFGMEWDSYMFTYVFSIYLDKILALFLQILSLPLHPPMTPLPLSLFPPLLFFPFGT